MMKCNWSSGVFLWSGRQQSPACLWLVLYVCSLCLVVLACGEFEVIIATFCLQFSCVADLSPFHPVPGGVCSPHFLAQYFAFVIHILSTTP